MAHTLRIHDGDVLDIAWSPGDVWLATASVDNTVVVWDVEKLPSTVAILKWHTGHVKGVTWDPVGKYLATQSADKTLRVWRTSDWGEEAKRMWGDNPCAQTGLESGRSLHCERACHERGRTHRPDPGTGRMEVGLI